MVTAADLDVDALADVLRRTASLSHLDVALGIAAAGVLVVPTVPGDKNPMLTKSHTASCERCRAAGLGSTKDHGETRDPEEIRRYWAVHPDAGVGLKNHPQLVRGDADHADAAALKSSEQMLGYGRPHGEPLPFSASTPGGTYRRRYLHTLPEGVPPPGGGTPIAGVSWYGASGYVVVKGKHPTEGVDYPPFYGSITPLPNVVAVALCRSGGAAGGAGAPAASDEATAAFLGQHTGRERLALLDYHRATLAAAVPGERHHLAAGHLVAGLREAVAGLVPAQLVVEVVRDALVAAGWESSRLDDEFDALVAWAVGQVRHLTPDEARTIISDKRDTYLAAQADAATPEALREMWDALVPRDLTDAELDEIERRHNPPMVPVDVDPDTGELVVRIERDGATFILDEPAELEPRWGAADEVLWARGESAIIAGPPGVGKTTLAGQVLAGLIGVRKDVLGYPVRPAQRVLYLAMDRPRQVRRAFRRLFREADRHALAERLVMRPGPLVTDLGRVPDGLLRLAVEHGCDVVVVDSLKDAAVKMTDDEVGGNVNRALQMCAAADIDVLVLHHQRKGQGGQKPTSLEDVYGSTWITAGAGSVILLWGDPGSELVELSHLKFPSDPVGPLEIEHDHHRGESTVRRGFDALAFLRHRGATGATVSEAAQAEHGGVVSSTSPKWKRTERRLRSLVKRGLARHEPQLVPGSPGRYFYVDTERGHAPFGLDVDAA